MAEIEKDDVVPVGGTLIDGAPGISPELDLARTAVAGEVDEPTIETE